MLLLRRVLLSWALLIVFVDSSVSATGPAVDNPIPSNFVTDWSNTTQEALQLIKAGRSEQAEQRLADLISRLTGPSSEIPRSLAQLLLARLLVSENRDLPGAKALLEDAEVYIGDALGVESPELGQAWHLEGRILLLEGDVKAAEDVLRKALAIAKRAFGADSTPVGLILSDLAVAYDRLGRTDIALPIRNRAEKLLAQPISAPASDLPSTAATSATPAAVPESMTSTTSAITDAPLNTPSRLSRGTRAYIISLAIILFFTAIHFLLSFSRLESYFRFGVFWCVISLAIGCSAVLLASASALSLSVRECLLIAALISVLNLMVSTLGMSYCSYSAIADAPMLRGLLRKRAPTVAWTTWSGNVVAVVVIGTLYVRGLAILFSCSQLNDPLIPGGMVLLQDASFIAAFAAALSVAITEALIFRLFLQNFIAAVAQLSNSR